MQDASVPVVSSQWFEARMASPKEAKAAHALYESKIEFYLRARQEIRNAPPH